MVRYEKRATLAIGCACLLAFLGSTMATAQSPPPIFNPPKSYYLALGDSIAYGYQSSKAGLPASGFNTGYGDVFGARLRQIQPGITTINYGCVGETTDSFLNGGCIGTTLGQPLHDAYSGSQMQAALTFLQGHRSEVSPITLTLWGNDVSKLVTFCSGDLTCIRNGAPELIRQTAFNISDILSKIRSVAPNAEIIVTGAWDSFLEVLAFADPLFQALNESIAEAAAANRARFADPFPIFNPQGDLNAEVQAMCTLTLLCTAGDSHPSDAGYRALAGIVFDASQYIRLLE
jgi:lysophospholipase L1-like esterase